MAASWQPVREPLRNTLLRTALIAIVAGAALARSWGGWGRWPIATLSMLWISFGGHWVELWFLNWLRPRLSRERGVQVLARLGTWFIGGVVLFAGAGLTAVVLAGFEPRHWPVWWVGGLIFIGVELVVHLALRLFGRSSIYDGRG